MPRRSHLLQVSSIAPSNIAPPPPPLLEEYTYQIPQPILHLTPSSGEFFSDAVALG